MRGELAERLPLPKGEGGVPHAGELPRTAPCASAGMMSGRPGLESPPPLTACSGRASFPFPFDPSEKVARSNLPAERATWTLPATQAEPACQA